ncbi:MAG TPA: Mu-like prophage major head subunit gpT family protein, partial [Planctomycetota bacterium]|nr:Mu-like prophage major head subunit gpT family protein [Planctomycetota bacterium]
PDTAARHYPAPVVEAAQRLGSGGFYGVLSALARRTGQDAPPRDNWLAGSFSTMDLPTIISGGIEKMLLDAFQQAPNSIRTVAKRVPLSNFRSTTMVRLDPKGSLEEVAADGELQHLSLEETTASIRLSTYGRMIGLTRQAMINDDLGAFNQLPQDFANLASRKIADVGWTLILSNPSTFFGTDNANLLSGGSSPLSVASLSAAITLLRQQIDANGSPIDIEPRFLVVPPELEFTARQIIVSTQFARDVSSDDNLPMGQGITPNLQLVVEPRISAAAFTGSSTTQWYVLPAPVNAAIALGLLNSREQPVIEQLDPPTQYLGRQWRAYLDFGVALVEPRVAVKSNGV